MSTIDGLGEAEDNVVDAQVVGVNAPGNSSALDGSSPTRPVLQVLQRLSRRETLVDISTILLWVVLSDVLLYHSGGYTAWGLFLTSAAAIMLVVRRQLGHAAYTLATCGLILACGLKLAWCGSLGTVVSGVALLMALSMSINGTPPYLPDMLRFALHVVAGSGFRVSRFSLRGVTSVAAGRRSRYAIALPLLVVTAFSLIFVRANPDLYQWLDGHVRTFITRVGEWFSGFEAWEIVFWCFSAWLGIGLIYPAANYLFSLPVRPEVKASVSSDSYLAVRNMLMSVVVLFAVYLAFEFVTLWFREFPEGFYYAGYAHEGAFWLTVALALATLVLSMAFRGTLVQDPRIGFLKIWAWIWSAENFLLGLAVVHRLFIYIDFNGMTRMRVIGLLGTLAVVIGFALVVYKILRGRDFLWLIRHQLWTAALVAVLYTILPVDYAVHSYNARQILSGNPAPSTQIPTHETSSEGLIPLVTLLESSDASIRVGIEATLAQWLSETKTPRDWRSQQWVDRVLRDRLRPHMARLAPYVANPELRKARLAQFYAYAYQWY